MVLRGRTWCIQHGGTKTTTTGTTKTGTTTGTTKTGTTTGTTKTNPTSGTTNKFGTGLSERNLSSELRLRCRLDLSDRDDLERELESRALYL